MISRGSNRQKTSLPNVIAHEDISVPPVHRTYETPFYGNVKDSREMRLKASGQASQTSKSHADNSNSFRVTSSRLEEVKGLLMSFQSPGKKPSVIVEKTSADLTLCISGRGGHDSLLEVVHETLIL